MSRLREQFDLGATLEGIMLRLPEPVRLVKRKKTYPIYITCLSDGVPVFTACFRRDNTAACWKWEWGKDKLGVE